MKAIFNFIRLGCVFYFALFIAGFYSISVKAEIINSPNFQIDKPNLDIETNKYIAPLNSTKISSVLGITAANQFATQGFIINRGFNNDGLTTPLVFTVSDTSVFLETVNPNYPVTAEADLTVDFSKTNGYQITTLVEDSLKTLSGVEILDTSCDPTTPCTASVANLWNSRSAYGFGYNISSLSNPNDVPIDFRSSSNNFRPFSTFLTGELPQVVMSGAMKATGDTQNKITSQSKVTFKLNTSRNQTEGFYTTVVQFTATPHY